MTTTSRIGSAPIAGGSLAYEVLPGSSDPILAIHGVSSHRRLWLWLHEEAPELTLITPDLRGRADSVDVPGPYSPAQHAQDMVGVLDAAGVDRVPVIGMSMGGFVAVHLAAHHPDRVRSLILVDGGFPSPPPPGATPEDIALAFADRIGRLDRRWDSVDEYLDYFCGSTAPLLDRDDPLLRAYVEHDLRDGRVRLSGEALLSDATETFFGDLPWEAVDVPVRFLHAQWGVGPDSPPMYAAELATSYAARAVTAVGVDGVDHAASIMSPKGAAATAALVREALS